MRELGGIGGSLPIAKKRKSSKKSISEADDDEASEPKAEKIKKENAASHEQVVGSAMPTIQEEVEDLDLVKVLSMRTRHGPSTGSSQSLAPKPTIAKK